MIRKASGLLQSCKQMAIVSSSPDKVDILKRAVAVNQHHDAVTGTSKQAVADDYALRLSEGSDTCAQVRHNYALSFNFSYVFLKEVQIKLLIVSVEILSEAFGVNRWRRNSIPSFKERV